nr:transposase [Frankia sp. Cas3]
MLVTTADTSDGHAGLQMLTTVAATHPRIRKAWADSAYRTAVIEHGARLGIDVETVHRDPTTKGFIPLPHRWIVERTFGWLMAYRRLARDYETHPTRSEAMIHLEMIDLMTRRIAGESTPTWRGTCTRIKRNPQDRTPSESGRVRIANAIVAACEDACRQTLDGWPALTVRDNRAGLHIVSGVLRVRADGRA